MAVPPDFVAGQVLTAAQMNKIGLWLIKTQTIGTGVSSVTVSDAFSADYDTYFVVLEGGVASTSLGLSMTLGATTTGYYYASPGLRYDSSASNATGQNQASWAVIGAGSTNNLHMATYVDSPFLAKRTLVYGHLVFSDASINGFYRNYGGFLDNATSYTAFTLTTSTGTITGGTIHVYGLRD